MNLLLHFIQLYIVLNGKYILITLDNKNDKKVRARSIVPDDTDYIYQTGISSIAEAVKSLGNSTGYRKLENGDQTDQKWDDFFKNHKHCNEKSIKCRYMDRCSRTKDNQRPCKNVQIGSWKGDKNIVCAKPNEIRPCNQENKEKCGPIYYYFTECSESDSKNGEVCFCLDEDVVRTKSLKPTDKCTRNSTCQYADFCSPQKGNDICSKMNDVFVPNPKPSSKNYQPVLKVAMKCASLTKKKMNDWDSPSCDDKYDICSCQDSGLE